MLFVWKEAQEASSRHSLLKGAAQGYLPAQTRLFRAISSCRDAKHSLVLTPIPGQFS